MRIVIIGAGLAASALVNFLRPKSRGIDVTVVTRCDGHQYYKPVLSEGFHKIQHTSELITLTCDQWRECHGIVVYPSESLVSIDCAHKRVTTNQQEIDYDHCVIATGAQVRALPMDVGGGKRVFHVNDLEHYLGFRRTLSPGHRVAVFGGGMVGCEIASDLAAAGFDARLFMRGELPLSGEFPDIFRRRVSQHLRFLGVKTLAGASVETMTDNTGTNSADALHIVTSAGSHHTADIALNCTGLNVDTRIAQQAGIHCEHGIVVDEYSRTSQPDVYALGDCAQAGLRCHRYVASINSFARNLASTLCGIEKATKVPHVPVVLKLHGAQTSFMSDSRQGVWECGATAQGFKALRYDHQRRLTGFILQGDGLAEQGALLSMIHRAPQTIAI